MTAKTRSHLVPKLRFPEFEDAEPWERLTIDAVAELKNGYAFKSDTYVETGDFHIVTIGNVQEGRLELESTKSIATLPQDIQDHQILKPADILVSMTGNVGRVCLVSADDLLLNQRVGKLIPRRIDRDFFFQLLNREEFRSAMQLAAAGGAQGNVSASGIKSFAFARPVDPTEQRSIADCLGSLDDLIAADGRKLEALRQHKQGLMQQLFPQPGETRPRLRFPEFEDAPDWEEVTLGTLLDRPPDYGVNAAAVPFSESLPTYIRITDINDDGQFASRARVSVDIDATDEQYLEDGDIVLARTGASVGKSYRYREEDGRLVYAGFLIRVRPSPERLLSQFLAAYLSTWSYWDWVRLTSERSGQPGVNATEYASIPLPLPPDRRTLAEQQKIADCLTSIDDQLNAQARKLDTLKQHKQGLQQQLFPSLDGQ